MNYEVFISYSNKDRVFANTLKQHLTDMGVPCWIDKEGIGAGEDWTEEIAKALGQVYVMVLVYSSNSIESKEVKNELALAADNNLAIIPVRIEDIKPSGFFAYKLARINWLDIFEMQQDKLRAIAESIKSRVDKLKTSTEPQQAENEVGKTVSEPSFVENEKKYLNALRIVYDDDVVSPSEREKLNDKLMSLDIDIKRAKELEAIVVKEISTARQTEPTPASNQETASQPKVVHIEENKAGVGIAGLSLAEKFVSEELNVDYSKYLVKYGCRFETFIDGPTVWIGLDLPKPCFTIYFRLNDEKVFIYFDDVDTSKDLVVRWVELHLANDFPGWSFSKKKTYEFVSLLNNPFGKGMLEKTPVEKFAEYKLITVKALNILFPALESLYNVVNEFNDYTGKLVAALNSIFSEDHWVIDPDEALLPRYAGIGVYKKNWSKADDKTFGLKYMICAEGGGAFVGCIFGVAKFDASFDDCRFPELLTTLNRILGEGSASSWWPYSRTADNCYAWPGPINIQELTVISNEDQDRFVGYYRNVFEKMKEIAPLIDEILHQQRAGQFDPDKVEPLPQAFGGDCTNIQAGTNARVELLTAFADELNEKHPDYCKLYDCKFEHSADENHWISFEPLVLNVCIYFGINDNEINFCFDDDGTSKDLVVRWVEQHLAGDFPGWCYSKKKTYEFVTLFKRPFEKGSLEKPYVDKFSEFKSLTMKALDVMLPKLELLYSVVIGFNTYIKQLVHAMESVFNEPDWVVEPDESLLSRYAGIGIYKKSWRRESDEKWGLSYKIVAEGGGAFVGCIVGVAKFDSSFEIDRLSEIHAALCDLLGKGEISSWWPYYRFAENRFAWPGPINVQELSVISDEDKVKYVEYFQGVFSKMKEIAPLIDEILGAGSK